MGVRVSTPSNKAPLLSLRAEMPVTHLIINKLIIIFMGLTTAVKNKCAKTRKEFKESSQVLSEAELEQDKPSSSTAPLSGDTEVLGTNDKGTTAFRLYTENGAYRIYTRKKPEDVPAEFVNHSFEISISDNGRKYHWYK